MCVADTNPDIHFSLIGNSDAISLLALRTKLSAQFEVLLFYRDNTQWNLGTEVTSGDVPLDNTDLKASC